MSIFSHELLEENGDTGTPYALYHSDGTPAMPEDLAGVQSGLHSEIVMSALDLSSHGRTFVVKWKPELSREDSGFYKITNPTLVRLP